MMNLANSWDKQQIKCLPRKLKKEHASIGNTIKFERNGYTIYGEVESYREHTVLVLISDADAAKLHLESPITLVNHKNYTVISSDNCKEEGGAAGAKYSC